MGNEAVHQSTIAECPATALSFRIRAPSKPRISRFGKEAAGLLEEPRPRTKLALALYELTDSPVFSWRAASAVCKMLGIRPDSSSPLGEPGRELISSAMKLILSAIRASQDDAYRLASAMENFAGYYRKDNLALFFEVLRPIAEANPQLAVKAMQCFGNCMDQSLLRQYALTLEYVNNRGGAKPMERLAELFSDFARYPESARALLESYLFSLTNMEIDDVDKFTMQFCGDWKKSLSSDAFRDNPPD